MENRIVGFSGKIGSGKDEAAKIIQSIQHNIWTVKKYGGKLKEVASLMLNIPVRDFEDREVKDRYLPEWGMDVRTFLQKLGTDAVRKGLHTQAWVNSLFADLNPNDNWLITDVRFENEVRAITARGGYVIRIERDGLKQSDHESETALDNREWLFDAVIHNNGSLNDFKVNLIETFAKFKLL